ncbi:MAG TPA: lysophospholipid acyltransferase family protein [Dongiaceae bacterium]|jgi:1-acyl-sn-glycerol-3-phosphate acyltransferase|nr:lysophospholipid acyltransferase family protein [Dongiaceae bacterium]
MAADRAFLPTSAEPAFAEDPIAEGIAPFGSDLLGARRLIAYLLLTVALMPVQALLVLSGTRLAERLPLFYHRLCCRLMGIDVVPVGEMSQRRPTLFVSNHTSYLDITVLGSLIPGSFVAKAEVAQWPMYGWLAKLQRTVFVERRRQTSHRQRDQLQERLAAGDNLILFPEGTSNDGNRVLPFRSALLSVAEADTRNRLMVQPVSVAYVALNGIPMGHGLRPLVAWYGDMTLGPHLWQFSRLGKITVVVEFHPPVNLMTIGDRKKLTGHCAAAVASGVEKALTGRTLAPEGKDAGAH